MAALRVKICGLTRPEDIVAASRAAYVGFVFFPKSARHLSLSDATALARAVPVGQCKVALTVDPSDRMLDQLLGTVPIDMLQLHGNESPERVDRIRTLTGLPVMKAVGIADEIDLTALVEYADVADQILVDAKPAKGADLPGGNGLAFDWRLLAGRRWAVPWMLAGGLNAANVAEAVRLTGAMQVDVSSGVESATGIKDPVRIADFIAATD